MQETYKPEPELLGALPRTMAWRNPKSRRGLITVAIFEAVLVTWAISNSFSMGFSNTSHPMFVIPWGLTAAFLPGFCIMLLSAAKQRKLIEEGLPVGALITNTNFDRYYDRGAWVERCTLWYEFRVDGTHDLIRGKMAAANPGIGNAVEIDDILTVLYLPDNPRINMLYAQSYFMAEGAEVINADFTF